MDVDEGSERNIYSYATIKYQILMIYCSLYTFALSDPGKFVICSHLTEYS